MTLRSYREIPRFRDVSSEQWADWRWQLRNRLTSVKDLEDVLNLTDGERVELQKCCERFRMSITPFYASLMDPDDPSCPIRRQAVPTMMELVDRPEDLVDSTAEETDSPTPRVTHRYPDRVLFAATDMCSMYCRHCTRRRNVGCIEHHANEKEINDAITYLERSPEVRDVLISGGDPLTMGDDQLESIIARVREIPHVEIIRIGSRMPVVLPQRITPELCSMLEKYHPLFLNTHFNTPKELTDQSRQACARLASAGIPLGNQSVLLRGVNDCAHVMKKLVQGLLEFRVRPYYIYQCDNEPGIGHFRTTIAKGIEIMESLRGHTSGLAQPLFIVEAIGGGGKTPVMPQYVISQSPDAVVLRNYEGIISVFREPGDYRASEVSCDVCTSGTDPRIGVAGLFGNDEVTLDYVTEKRYEKVRVRSARMDDIHGRREVQPFLEARRGTRNGVTRTSTMSKEG